MTASLAGLSLKYLHVWKDNSLTSVGFSREWSLDGLFFGGVTTGVATPLEG